MKPTTKKSIDKIKPQNFVVEKIILGPISRAIDIKIWNVGNTRISQWIWKDDRDKKELKYSMWKMIEYIHEL